MHFGRVCYHLLMVVELPERDISSALCGQYLPLDLLYLDRVYIDLMLPFLLTSLPTSLNQAELRCRSNDIPGSSGYCPCAGCQGHGTFKIEFQQPVRSVEPTSIEAVGNYGISFLWSDGHATGIYRYDFLRAICPCGECVTARGQSDGEDGGSIELE